MLRRCLIVLMMLLIGYAAKAAHHHLKLNGVNIGQLLSPDPDPTGDFQNLTIPIKRAGNLIIVEAQIDTLEGNFVLDTGAPYLVLNATYFRDLPKISERDCGGINGHSTSFTTVVHNFSLGFDLHYDKLTADVTDLSAIENSRKIKILGLLGTRMFSKLAITVDLFKNVLYIHKLGKDGEINPGELPYQKASLTTPFKLLNDVIFLKAEINGKSNWFAFDSGAESNLLDYHVSDKILKVMQVINKSKLTGVGETTFEVIYARFDKLTIGGYDFPNNRIVISNLEAIGRVYDYTVDGILGYDFYSRGIFTINFVKKEFSMYIYLNQPEK
jgi:hypothetical protein